MSLTLNKLAKISALLFITACVPNAFASTDPTMTVSEQAANGGTQETILGSETSRVATKSPILDQPDAEKNTANAGTDDGVRIIINFDDNNSIVDQTSKALLSQHAAFLKNNPSLVVTLLGYIDFTGSRSYDIALTEERMNSVRKILYTLGIKIDQIRWRSEGPTEEAPLCNTAKCRQFRQRVELVYAKNSPTTQLKPKTTDRK